MPHDLHPDTRRTAILLAQQPSRESSFELWESCDFFFFLLLSLPRQKFSCPRLVREKFSAKNSANFKFFFFLLFLHQEIIYLQNISPFFSFFYYSLLDFPLLTLMALSYPHSHIHTLRSTHYALEEFSFSQISGQISSKFPVFRLEFRFTDQPTSFARTLITLIGQLMRK